MTTAGSLAAGTANASLRRQRFDVAAWIFSAILLLSLLFTLALLIILVSDQLIRGMPSWRNAG